MFNRNDTPDEIEAHSRYLQEASAAATDDLRATIASLTAEITTLRARLETVEAETRERCAEEVAGMAMLFVNGPAKTVYGKGYQDGCNKAADAIRNLEPRHD